MTNNDSIRDSIRELEELYPVLSEEKKRAIDKAIESMRFCIAVDNMGSLIGSRDYSGEPKTCYNCKHKEKKLTEEPCIVCSILHNKWEDIQNGKS